MKIRLSLELQITKERLNKLGFIHRTEVHSDHPERNSYVMGNFKLDGDGYHDQIIYIPELNVIREYWFANLPPFYREVKVETMKDIKNFLKEIKILNERSDNVKKFGKGCLPENRGKYTKIRLMSIRESKVKVIKEVSNILNINLIEAKWIVDDAPVIIKEDITKEEAMIIYKRLTDAGAEMYYSEI